VQDTDLVLFGIVLVAVLAINNENAVGTLIAVTSVLLDELANVLGKPFQVDTEFTGYVATVTFS
jgi:hypothetical protein